MEHRRKEDSLCEGLAEYMLNEGTEVERKRFERHLAECPACRMEAAAWREAWDELHGDMELLEPPSDLKEQVLDAIGAAEREEAEQGYAERGDAEYGYAERGDAEYGYAERGDEGGEDVMRGHTERGDAEYGHAERGGKDGEDEVRGHAIRGATPPVRPARRRVGRWAAAAVALAIVFAAGWWGHDALRGSSSAPSLALPEASRIDALFPLAADPASGKLADNPRAYGIACVVSASSGQPKQLIVYLFGAPKTTGTETYQVWLWDDGTRHSAGTLQVADSGIGVLAMPLTSDAPPGIQAIGVTLEPNGPSAAPQGPKVFGSSPDTPAWGV